MIINTPSQRCGRCEKLIRKAVLRGVVNLREVSLKTLQSLHIRTQSHIHKLEAINSTLSD